MSAGTLCSRVVALASPLESVYDAACRMLDQNVRTLVVIDEDRRPIGLLTDRDIVLRCVAQNRWAAYTALDEVMTTALRTVPESLPVDDALRVMQNAGVRRLVVTGADGSPMGILGLDDVLERLAQDTVTSGSLLHGEAAAIRA
ncbi:MAG: CBS domain-containing protein [Longimicrobiales bacterium]